MAHDLTESAAFTAAVTVPDPGDNRTAASVELPLQAVTNRTKLFRQQLTGVAGGVILDTPLLTTLVNCTGVFNCTGNATFSEDCTIGSDNTDVLIVNATSTFSAAITCSGAVALNGGATVNGSLVVTGTATVTGGLSVGGGVNTSTTQGADADTTYDAADVSCVIATSLTGNRTYDIAVATNGQEIEIVNKSTVQSVTVRGLQGLLPGTPSTLASGLISVSGSLYSVRLKRLGTNWIVVSHSKAP